MLVREFLKSQVTTNQYRQNLISSFRLPAEVAPARLSNLKDKVSRLIPIANTLINLPDLLEVLCFDINQLNDAIQYGLIPFTESLKPKATEQLEQQVGSEGISTTWLMAKGDEFQQRVYLESKVLINIDEKFNLEIELAFLRFLIPGADRGAIASRL